MKEVPVFVGRSRELATLNRLYETGTFQFPVIYGRRRVGKTMIICNDRPRPFRVRPRCRFHMQPHPFSAKDAA